MADKFSNRSAGIEREADAAGGFKPHKTGLLGKIEAKLDSLLGNHPAEDSRQEMLSGGSGVATTSGTGVTASPKTKPTSLADKIQNVIVGPPGAAPSDDGVTDIKGPAYADTPVDSMHGAGAGPSSISGHGATSGSGVSRGALDNTTPLTSAPSSSTEFSASDVTGAGGSTASSATGGSSYVSQDIPSESMTTAAKVPVHDEFDSTSTPTTTSAV